MTTYINPKQLMLLILTSYLFLGCSKHETVANVPSVETLEEPTVVAKELPTTQIALPPKSSSATVDYGQHKEEIEAILSVAPLGSEVYLEQKDDGAWYLKIEKTFTAKKAEEKKVEPVYGETILI